ncbi:MAG: cell division protein FtsX [Cytophagaceae bacterium]
MNFIVSIKKRKKNLGSYPYFTVILSITLSLFVIGLFALLYFHAQRLSVLIKENVEINVYLDKNLSETSLDSLIKNIGTRPFVAKPDNIPQISYVSLEQATEAFIKETGEDFSVILSENPLRPSLSVKINSDYFRAAKMKNISEQLKSLDGVFEVDYPVNLIEAINKNIRLISIVMGSFSLILIFVTILLINNTIKLALYSQRFLIRSMQLVGARRSFIQKPFLLRAAFQGFIAGVIASGLLAGVLHYAYTIVPELEQLKDFKMLGIILGSLIGAGIFIGLLSSFRAVRKYIGMSLDELY